MTLKVKVRQLESLNQDMINLRLQNPTTLTGRISKSCTNQALRAIQWKTNWDIVDICKKWNIPQASFRKLSWFKGLESTKAIAVLLIATVFAFFNRSNAPSA